MRYSSLHNLTYLLISFYLPGSSRVEACFALLSAPDLFLAYLTQDHSLLILIPSTEIKSCKLRILTRDNDLCMQQSTGEIISDAS